MVKIGPAFSDFVVEEKVKARREGPFFAFGDLAAFAPLFALVVLISILALRLFYLQILRGAYYKRLANENRTQREVIPASRGIVFDRAGRPLVRNSPSFKILENERVRALARDEALRGLAAGKPVASDVRRDYLARDAFSHVLGYVGQISREELARSEFSNYGISDFVGKAGLEKQYENVLHGKDGRKLYEVDSHGKRVRFLGQEEGIPGRDVHTTLDLDMQLAVARAMRETKAGAAIVSSARDGGILALYSSPSFDPNLFTQPQNYEGSGTYKRLSDLLSEGESRPFLDRALSGTYPPGSTFKLVVAASALEARGITENTEVEDTGILKVGAFSFANWYFTGYGRTEGTLDVVRAIKRSNDIFFYKAAESIGPDRLAAGAKLFGLGDALGIDLPGEARGTVPTTSWKKEVIHEPWYLGDTYHYGIGQGFLLTTPLQVNFWTSVFATRGILYRPHLLEGKKEVVRKDFVSRKNIELVREGMRGSCETGGVAWPLFDFKVENEKLKVDGKDYIEDASGSAKMVRVALACKTGTAENAPGREPHAWITVFAPYFKPEIVVTVLVENGGEGSNVAAPIAKEILEAYFEKK